MFMSNDALFLVEMKPYLRQSISLKVYDRDEFAKLPDTNMLLSWLIEPLMIYLVRRLLVDYLVDMLISRIMRGDRAKVSAGDRHGCTYLPAIPDFRLICIRSGPIRTR